MKKIIDGYGVDVTHLKYKGQRYGGLKSSNNWKKFRNACSGYGARRDVRRYIFNRDGNKCLRCGSTNNLTIDHIKSACYCFSKGIHITVANRVDNLQTLCSSCNSWKAPMKSIDYRDEKDKIFTEAEDGQMD